MALSTPRYSGACNPLLVPAPWCQFPWAAQSTRTPGRGTSSPHGCPTLAVATLSLPLSSSAALPGLALQPGSHSHIPVNLWNKWRCISRI